MQLTVNTNLLQTMVSRSMKGAGNNKMLPLTGFMGIELSGGKLSLITTDGTNFLYVREPHVAGDDFYVVVPADLFSKLIGKLTCETVKLTLEANSLKVIGNGTYLIELPLDEEGQPVVFPDPIKSTSSNLEDIGGYNLSTFKLILATAKAALADASGDVVCYTGYYVGNKIVTTDTYKMCGIDIPMWDNPTLIAASTMDLMDVFTQEHIDVSGNEDNILFHSVDCDVYAELMPELTDYSIDAVNGLLDEEYDHVCKVSKNDLLQLLDRLSLFVGVYDKNGIYLTFTPNGLQIDSKQANSTEVVDFLESSNFADFTCCIDIEMFRSQVKANTADAIEIHYGKENAIKMCDSNVTQVIALTEDDR